MTSKLTREGDEAADVLKNIAIFGNKQRLLSIDMKTKVVQHVPWIIFSVFQVFKFSKTFLCLTARQTDILFSFI